MKSSQPVENEPLCSIGFSKCYTAVQMSTKEGKVIINELGITHVPVIDTYNINYVTCLLLGLSSLLSNGCVFAAIDYITQYQQKSIIFAIDTIMNITNLTAITILIPFNRFIPTTLRIIFFSFLISILFFITPHFVHNYWFILFLAGCCGFTGGTLSTTIIGYSQIFSQELCILFHISVMNNQTNNISLHTFSILISIQICSSSVHWTIIIIFN